MKVGYVGLGALGSQLARRFIGSADLWVWDVNAETRAAFARESGVHVANSAADVARNCETIFVCLPRSSDVRNMVFAEDGLAAGLTRGSLIIDQTSGVPEETRQIANELAKCGVALIDAAVSASPHIVPLGGATLMVGAPDQILERATPILRVITETIYRCGTRVGDGQAMKIVNNAMNATTRLGTLEVAVLGRKSGMSLADMAAFLNEGSARNQTTDKMLPALVEGKSSTNFALALMLKDVNQAMSLGMAVGTPMPVTSIVRALLQIGANTLGERAKLEDMVGVIEKLAGTRLASSEGEFPRKEAGARHSPATQEQQRTKELLEQAIASLCLHITYECAMVGVKYGLAMKDISDVVNKSSGWSASSRTLLPLLADGKDASIIDVQQSIQDLNQVCSLAIRLGAPLLIVNSVRNIWEQALNAASDQGSVDLAEFYQTASKAKSPAFH
ncbi:NAD-binding protein [Caballeronia sp. EK]|uniref:NAD(P)-dependent oxidoreductase n=1 Tax=Caballeronia sp. EK TaxID=2767469 RepID=UPI0016558DD7|nr:NAD(P)-dependent oxidoreductase [Caballeronia sp. EK]MBC8641353.1 NAD-binding protein [Caballeronia sp. EK]